MPPQRGLFAVEGDTPTATSQDRRHLYSRALIRTQPGPCRSGDDHAGDMGGHQRVARSYGSEQPAGQAFTHTSPTVS